MKLTVFIILAVLFLVYGVYKNEDPIGEILDYDLYEIMVMFIRLIPRIIIIGIAYIILF
jgi:hypothetical protein